MITQYGTYTVRSNVAKLKEDQSSPIFLHECVECGRLPQLETIEQRKWIAKIPIDPHNYPPEFYRRWLGQPQSKGRPIPLVIATGTGKYMPSAIWCSRAGLVFGVIVTVVGLFMTGIGFTAANFNTGQQVLGPIFFVVGLALVFLPSVICACYIRPTCCGFVKDQAWSPSTMSLLNLVEDAGEAIPKSGEQGYELQDVTVVAPIGEGKDK